nr:MAG TPA: hypothetical protein [Caudoviricetes sp.]
MIISTYAKQCVFMSILLIELNVLMDLFESQTVL